MKRELAKYLANNIVGIFNILLHGDTTTSVCHGGLCLTSKNINGYMDRLELIKAYADGATIQYYEPMTKNWIVMNEPNFDSPSMKYRVKPEPREYVIVYSKLTGGPVSVLHGYEAKEYEDTPGYEYVKVREIQ